MPPGTWRRRPPLPPSPGTSVVCPIGEATPPQAAAYAAARNSNDEEDEMGEIIATWQDAERLPVGTVIGIPPLWMTTAEKRPNVFLGGRAGWIINGVDFPVSDGQLFAYGRGWVVKPTGDAR